MTCAKINEPLRMTKEYPKVQCHSDKLTDMAFVPYYSNYLATGSLNSEISLWRLPEDINEIPALKPITVLNKHSKKINILEWSPSVFGLLASASND